MQTPERNIQYNRQFISETGEALISLSLITGPVGVRSEANLSQIVNIEPHDMFLRETALLRIPHCGILAADQPEVTAYRGVRQNNTIEWRSMSVADGSCRMAEHCFEVKIRRSGMFCIAVRDRSGMDKQLRVLPLINRITRSADDLVITLWLYNDDAVEHIRLKNEEVGRKGKIQLNSHASFRLSSLKTSLSASISIFDKGLFTLLDTGERDISHDDLWTQSRCMVEFRLKNRGYDGRIGLEVNAGGLSGRRSLCSFNVKIEIQKLLSPSSESTVPLQYQDEQDVAQLQPYFTGLCFSQDSPYLQLQTTDAVVRM